MVLATMEEPFPELTDLSLWSYDKSAPALSDSFLGGSAPSLRSLWLDGIPFPGLLKLPFSSHLVSLRLLTIPPSGYISPEAMVNCLSALTSLESLRLEFQSLLSNPDLESRDLPPRANVVLPALKDFQFKGVVSLSLFFKSASCQVLVASCFPMAPPLTRSVLPSFTKFCFKGVNEYPEDLVSRFDVPQLYSGLDLTTVLPR